MDFIDSSGPKIQIVTNIETSSSFFSSIDNPLLYHIYGSNQDKYREGCTRIINELVDRMRSAKERNQTGSFLSDVLPWLASSRGDLATELNSLDAICFGVSRLSESYKNVFYFTLLGSKFYQNAAEKFLNSLGDFIFQINPVSNEYGVCIQRLVPGYSYFKTVHFLGRSSRFRLTMYRPSDIHYISEKLLTNTSSNGNFFVANFVFAGNSEGVDLRPVLPDEWAHIDQSIEYLKNEASFEVGENTIYLLGTCFLEINGEEKALSSIMLQVSIDQKTGALVAVYPPVILHQRSFLISAMIQDIDRIFAQLFQASNTLPIGELIDLIGHIRYEFAHATPFVRGSAAIGEWIETAMYHFLGFNDFRQTPKTTIDLEAFSSLTLKEFIERYRLLIDEQKLNRYYDF
jgi:hypothetical protein